MILGMRTVLYYVPPERIDEAKAWYTQVLGKPPYFDEPFYTGFEVGGFELGLLTNSPPGRGGTVAYWGTADIVAEIARLQEIGAAVVEPIEDVGEGIKVAAVADPFGNYFGIIENPHFDLQKVR